MSVQIILTRPGEVSKPDKAKFEAAGILILETRNPECVRLLSVEPSPLPGNQLFDAAIQAIAAGNDISTCRTFASRLAELSKTVKS